MANCALLTHSCSWCRLSAPLLAHNLLMSLQGLKAQMEGHWARAHELVERLAHEHAAAAAHAQRAARELDERDARHEVSLFHLVPGCSEADSGLHVHRLPSEMAASSRTSCFVK